MLLSFVPQKSGTSGEVTVQLLVARSYLPFSLLAELLVGFLQMNPLAWAASIMTGPNQAVGAAQLDPAVDMCPQLKGNMVLQGAESKALETGFSV